MKKEQRTIEVPIELIEYLPKELLIAMLVGNSTGGVAKPSPRLQGREPKSRRRWSIADDTQLIALLVDGKLSYGELAEKLGRSYWAVKQRVATLRERGIL
ncbi:MAG: winged helix-turn-helix transcriptional regulator [Burkholderiaceae bacterium]|nr:winged helix-turn-helix transcriptional regulator [Burkholderiaceae bacterium]